MTDDLAEPLPDGGACGCGLSPADCHPDCPHHPLAAAINLLRRHQRHDVLRRYGFDGQVEPESLVISRALDTVIDAALSKATGASQ